MLFLLIVCFLAGALGAMLQGMLGVGTGIVIVPALTYLLPYYHFQPEQAIHIAIATAMAAITMNSITALRNHYRYNHMDWKLFRHLVVFSTLGSCTGAVIATFLQGNVVKNMFALFLLMLASYLLCKRKAHQIERTMVPMEKLGVKIKLSGFGIGCFASMVGSAGGVLMVPFLRKRHYPMPYAVGTSTLIGLPVAFMGTFMYIVLGMSKMPASPP